MKQILFEITDFKLDYDGVYKITIPDGTTLFACLPLDVILRMLEIEGLTNSDIYLTLHNGQPLEFKKVILVANALEYNAENEDEVRLVPFLTSELSDGPGLNINIQMFDFTIKEE